MHKCLILWSHLLSIMAWLRLKVMEQPISWWFVAMTASTMNHTLLMTLAQLQREGASSTHAYSLWVIRVQGSVWKSLVSSTNDYHTPSGEVARSHCLQSNNAYKVLSRYKALMEC